MSKNLGKEIILLFLVIFRIKIIRPIINVMGFNLMVREAWFKLMVREATATLKVLTFVSSLIRERIVKYKGDKDFFYLEGQFDKYILTVWVVHGYYNVLEKYLLPMERAIFNYEAEEVDDIVNWLLSNRAKFPYMFTWVEVDELLKAGKEQVREESKWDALEREIK
jgi:hypothetical protein